MICKHAIIQQIVNPLVCIQGYGSYIVSDPEAFTQLHQSVVHGTMWARLSRFSFIHHAWTYACVSVADRKCLSKSGPKKKFAWVLCHISVVFFRIPFKSQKGTPTMFTPSTYQISTHSSKRFTL